MTPTTWLAEGLLIYLTAAEAHRLLATVTQLSTPGSRLAFEGAALAAPSITTQARGLPAMRQFTALWKGGLGSDPAVWLDEHGWTSSTHHVRELAVDYGRPAPEIVDGYLVTAAR